MIFNCRRRGISERLEENPVSIVIMIPEEDEDNWLPIRLGIQKILDASGVDAYGVEVRIFRGELYAQNDVPACQVELQTDDFNVLVQSGTGIEHRLYGGPGTLGGFVELDFANGHVKVLGLTNYHVAFPDVPTKPSHEISEDQIYRGQNRHEIFDRFGIKPGELNDDHEYKRAGPKRYPKHSLGLEQRIDEHCC